MQSLLPSTLNTRWLPIGEERFLRSDVPKCLTEDEINWLLRHHVTVLVDLRSEEEASAAPCCLLDRPEFTYIHLPVTGGGNTPKSRAHLHQVYAAMADAQMDRILNTILGAKGNVMYFCTAGKDRTGAVSALLMKKLGFANEEIIADYLLSGELLKNMLVSYVTAHPEVDLDIIMPKRENMEKLLSGLPEAFL